MALDLLKNADLRGAIVAESEQRALEQVSFEASRSCLRLHVIRRANQKPSPRSFFGRVGQLDGMLDAAVAANERAATLVRIRLAAVTSSESSFTLPAVAFPSTGPYVLIVDPAGMNVGTLNVALVPAARDR